MDMNGLLSVLMGQTNSLSNDLRMMRINYNVIARLLYEKNIITEDDIKNQINKELDILLEIGAIEQKPTEKELNRLYDDILLWVKGDPNIIKEKSAQYEKEFEEMINSQRNKIQVATTDTLNTIDRISKINNNKSPIIL